MKGVHASFVTNLKALTNEELGQFYERMDRALHQNRLLQEYAHNGTVGWTRMEIADEISSVRFCIYAEIVRRQLNVIQ